MRVSLLAGALTASGVVTVALLACILLLRDSGREASPSAPLETVSGPTLPPSVSSDDKLAGFKVHAASDTSSVQPKAENTATPAQKAQPAPQGQADPWAAFPLVAPTAAPAQNLQNQPAPSAPPLSPKDAGDPIGKTLTPKQLYAKVSPAVMSLVVRDRESKETGRGTGFLVSSDGLIVTNCHVIDSAYSVSAKFTSGEEYLVEGVVATNKDADLAILKIKGANFPTLELGGGALPAVGTKVFAIGNPRGLANTLSDGLISGHRPVTDGLSLLQTTAPISPGSSGGPLLDETGTVVGVTTLFIEGGQNLNFAIPVALAKSLIDKRGPLSTLASAGGGSLRHVDTYNSRGLAYSANSDYDNAIANFTEAIRIDPKYAKAYFNRGWVYGKKGDNDKAIADYTDVIRLDPKYVNAYYNRGLAYERKHDYDKAIADYTELIRLDPKNANAYYWRGLAYWGKPGDRDGDDDKAIADFTEAIRLDPKNSKAYFYRGWAYKRKRDYDKAIADFTEVIRLDPKDAEAYNWRGFAYRDKADHDKEIADYTEAIRLDPKNSEAYNWRGWAYERKGDYDKAIADFTELIRLDPKNAKAYYWRSKAYKAKGDSVNADKDLRQAVKLGTLKYKPPGRQSKR